MQKEFANDVKEKYMIGVVAIVLILAGLACGLYKAFHNANFEQGNNDKLR